MATSTPTKTTPSPTVAPAVAQSIQSQIAQIQSGINSLKGGSTPSTSSTPSPGGAVVGNRIIGAGGVDLGPANPADIQGAGSPKYSTPSIGPTQQMNTSQQNPATPQANPNAQAPQELVNQAGQVQQSINQLAQSKGITLKQNATGGYSSVPDLGSQYKQAFGAVSQTGQPAPQNPGAGSAVVGAALNSYSPQQESPSILGGLQETDGMFDKLFTSYDEFFSPEVQRTSLVDEYSKLSKSLGIDELNKELIDTKKIIDGTEDDIRNEITSAGGMATDSQVLAMANARNKSLIKNYNYLLDTKNAATTQLTTMMQLSVQDRQFAEAEFDRKLNFGFKVAEFKQKATDNARAGLKWAIENGGGAEILKSPYETSLTEKTLGLPAGSLAGIVAKQKLESSLATRKAEAEIANLNSQIKERGSGSGVKTEVVEAGGRKYLINSQTGATIKEIGAGSSNTQLQLAQSQGNIQQINELVNNSALKGAVGPNKFARFTPLASLTGSRSNFIAGIEQLRSNLNLDTLIQAKAKGATFGALSDQELQVLSNAATKLGSYAKKNDDGKVVGYEANEKDFRTELDKINNYAKLDYLLKGGDPASVGVQKVGEHYFTKNSDGSVTQID